MRYKRLKMTLLVATVMFSGVDCLGETGTCGHFAGDAWRVKSAFSSKVAVICRTQTSGPVCLK